jgi:hypothetical protein
MTLPVVAVTKPADLAGVENGKLPSSLLVDVDGYGKLHHLAARAFAALVAGCAGIGLPLTFTKGGLYRTYRQQETLFRSRYEIGGTGGGCKTWNGERWCKKVSGLATAAVPGTSNHGWGLAIDTAYDSNEANGVNPEDAAYIKGHPAFDQFVELVGVYGFSFELQSEPWHIRYVTGDDIPQAVLDYESDGTVDPIPQEGTFMQWLDTIRLGSFGNTVTIAQALLRSRGHSSLQVDGQFGGDTENHVRFFQHEFGLVADGIVGPKTWHALGATTPNVDAG